jgi:hypoxanthine phosphoribosyltransferase
VANESFENQTNTVHVNPEYRNLIRTSNRNILVFDDFTTTSKSLEWARNLLYAGGADCVVLLTIGKYIRGGSSTYLVYEPLTSDLITPYEQTDYDEADFTKLPYVMDHDPSARQVINDSFQYFKDGQRYPVERTR